MSNKQNEGFSSIFGFLMVVIGFAVGVGSLWRFPYVCGTNGGALFVLVYILVIILIGIPLLTAEISMGFATQKTAVGAYQTLAPNTKWHFASYLHILAGLLVFSYTVPIYAWILTYIYRTATGFFVGLDAAGIGAAFDALNADRKTMFLFAIINWALVAFVVQGGVQKGVEKVSKIMLPALAVIMVVCIVIGLRQEGSAAGVAFMLKPSLEDFSFNSFIAALGQAFFAIGIGMLASMVFGSYIKKKDEVIVKDSIYICVAIIAAGLAAGFMIFPLVFAFGLEPAAGVGLSLITLPNAFNAVAGGKILGTVFYIGFYFAAFTSAIGLCEACVGVVMDTFNLSRKKALLMVMAFAVVIGSISIVNLNFFDRIDVITCNYAVVIGAFLISVFVGWVWGIDKFLDAANIQNKYMRGWIGVCVKYVCPIAIAIIFMGNFISF